MSLLTYEEVRPWASVIKLRVQSRIMPPWPIDKTVGIQEFRDDASLTDEQIATIVGWVDAGAPLGDAADLPPPIAWPDYLEVWAFEEHFGRPPDLVISSPAYAVLAGKGDQWPNPVTEVTELKEERWISGVEVRPGTPETRYVFHHANPSLVLPDGERGSLVQSAVGTQGYLYPDDAGMLMKPGARVDFGMHFYPLEEDVEAVLQVGVWFHPLGDKPQFETQGEVRFDISQQPETPGDPQIPRARADLVIPPRSVVAYRTTHVLDRPARIHSLRGHMHLRGKYQMAEVVYPDGRWEVINKLDWDHAWHTSFLYEDHARPLLPKGSVLILTSVFDNTDANRYNPDPDQWVVAGERTVDEMSHIRFGITYFDDDEDFERLVAERERVLAEREATGGAAAHDP